MEQKKTSSILDQLSQQDKAVIIALDAFYRRCCTKILYGGRDSQQEPQISIDNEIPPGFLTEYQIPKRLSEAFIHVVENYFITQYNLPPFESYTPSYTRPHQTVSYKAIVANIIDQLGQDFNRAGTVFRLRQLLDERGLQVAPRLLDTFVYFPFAFTYRKTAPQDYEMTENATLRYLLPVLNLLYANQVGLDKAFERYIEQWAKSFFLSRDYYLTDDISIMFQADNGISLSFSTPEAAELLYQLLIE